MKTQKFIIAAICAATVVAMSARAMAYEVRAVATSVQGAVERTTGLGEDKWAKVRNGDIVLSGDRLRTGADGSFILTYDDGNVVAVSSLTRVRVGELVRVGNRAQSDLTVRNGRVLAYAKKLRTPDSTFVVKTPYGVAGVRGSEIAVTVGDDGTLLQIVSGVFDVSVADARAELTAGYQMMLGKDAAKPADAEAIPADKLEALKAEVAAKKKEGDTNAATNKANENASENIADLTTHFDQIRQAIEEHSEYYY